MLWQALEILLDGYLPEEGIMVLCLILGVQQKDQHECCQGVSAFMLLARAWHYFQIPDPNFCQNHSWSILSTFAFLVI